MKKIFYGWWIVLACSLIGLYVSGFVFFGVTAFFEPVRETFGWSYTQISFATSLSGIEMGIFAPFAGFLVDRFGPRRLILWGTFIVGVGLILFSRTQSLLMFYVAFLVIAFGAGGCTVVVTMTAVSNWFHKKIGLALGLLGSGFGAGGLVVLLIVQLIELYQWRTTLIILAIGTWALGIPLSFVIRNRPEEYGYLPDGELSNSPAQEVEPQAKGEEIGVMEAFKREPFPTLNIVEGIRLIIIGALILHIMPYLSSVGVPRSTAGLVASAVPLLSIIGRSGFGWLSDVVNKKYIMALTFALISLGMLTFGFVYVGWVIFPFLVIFPLGHGGSMVIRGSILRDYFGRDAFGKMIGIIMGSGAVGGIIGPTLAGWIFDVFGNYQPVWFIFFAISGFAVILILKMKPPPMKMP